MPAASEASSSDPPSSASATTRSPSSRKTTRWLGPTGEASDAALGCPMRVCTVVPTSSDSTRPDSIVSSVEVVRSEACWRTATGTSTWPGNVMPSTLASALPAARAWAKRSEGSRSTHAANHASNSAGRCSASPSSAARALALGIGSTNISRHKSGIDELERQKLAPVSMRNTIKPSGQMSAAGPMSSLAAVCSGAM